MPNDEAEVVWSQWTTVNQEYEKEGKTKTANATKKLIKGKRKGSGRDPKNGNCQFRSPSMETSWTKSRLSCHERSF